MNPTSTSKYARLSDKEIITSIIIKPYNEEAAAYLLYERYSPIMFSGRYPFSDSGDTRSLWV